MANLKDLILDGVLREDVNNGKTQGTLTVIGNNGQKGNHKKLIVTCSVCSSDRELFEDGYFAIHKGHFDRNCKPCGCSDKANWTEHQYIVRAERACISKGIKFKGWCGEFDKANFTRVLVECPEHGEYTIILSTLLDPKLEKGCRSCFNTRMGNFKRVDDQIQSQTFMNTGGFADGTVFVRSDRKDKNGYKKYWYMYCPDCNADGESHIASLLLGFRSCECVGSGPRQTYINLIKDGESLVALKFGVSVQSSVRLAKQNFMSIYTIENYGVWKYSDSVSCRAAERDCVNFLDTRVLSKEEMSDGFTETTYPSNLQKIIDIYHLNGGVRVK